MVSSFCLQGGLSVFILQKKKERGKKERGKKHAGLFAYFFFIISFNFLLLLVEPIQGELSQCEIVLKVKTHVRQSGNM